MTTQEAIMTTQAVADRFYQFTQENKWMDIQQELYAENAESIEPAHAASFGLSNVKGLDAIKKKGE